MQEAVAKITDPRPVLASVQCERGGPDALVEQDDQSVTWRGMTFPKELAVSPTGAILIDADGTERGFLLVHGDVVAVDEACAFRGRDGEDAGLGSADCPANSEQARGWSTRLRMTSPL